jgi:nucleoside-diphosphate-sugar epimerase
VSVLVCGLGYIGSALTSELLRSGREVTAFDNLYSTDRRAIDALQRHGSFQFVEGDIANAADVARLRRADAFDSMYFLAGQASADDRRVLPEVTERANLVGPRVLFDAFADCPDLTVVVAGSLRVLGQPLPTQFDDQSPYAPQRDLSHLSKIYLEHLVHLYAARGAWRAVTARLPIVYGLGPVMKRDPAFMTVANRFAWQARAGERLRVAAGAGHVSLLHLRDAVGVLIHCAARAVPGSRVYNVPGTFIRLAELAALVRDEARMFKWNAELDLPDEPDSIAPRDASYLLREGLTPGVGPRDGVHELLDFFSAIPI